MVQVVGPPVESPLPLGVPSVFQRTVPAVDVVVGNVATVPVVSWLALSGGAVKTVMRGPRPPEGLLISETSESVLAPRPPVFQLSVTVARRKSSGWVSGASVPADAGTGACGVQTFVGGVAATLSLGSSKVQTSAVTVYSIPRRLTVHGSVVAVSPILARRVGSIPVGVRLS